MISNAPNAPGVPRAELSAEEKINRMKTVSIKKRLEEKDFKGLFDDHRNQSISRNLPFVSALIGPPIRDFVDSPGDAAHWQVFMNNMKQSIGWHHFPSLLWVDEIPDHPVSLTKCLYACQGMYQSDLDDRIFETATEGLYEAYKQGLDGLLHMLGANSKCTIQQVNLLMDYWDMTSIELNQPVAYLQKNLVFELLRILWTLSFNYSYNLSGNEYHFAIRQGERLRATQKACDIQLWQFKLSTFAKECRLKHPKGYKKKEWEKWKKRVQRESHPDKGHSTEKYNSNMEIVAKIEEKYVKRQRTPETRECLQQLTGIIVMLADQMYARLREPFIAMNSVGPENGEGASEDRELETEDATDVKPGTQRFQPVKRETIMEWDPRYQSMEQLAGKRVFKLAMLLGRVKSKTAKFFRQSQKNWDPDHFKTFSREKRKLRNLIINLCQMIETEFQTVVDGKYTDWVQMTQVDEALLLVIRAFQDLKGWFKLENPGKHKEKKDYASNVSSKGSESKSGDQSSTGYHPDCSDFSEPGTVDFSEEAEPVEIDPEKQAMRLQRAQAYNQILEQQVKKKAEQMAELIGPFGSFDDLHQIARGKGDGDSFMGEFDHIFLLATSIRDVWVHKICKLASTIGIPTAIDSVFKEAPQKKFCHIMTHLKMRKFLESADPGRPTLEMELREMQEIIIEKLDILKPGPPGMGTQFRHEICQRVDAGISEIMASIGK